jgi:hypothetical protein
LICYFLAAGASEPFGYPVTKKFQEILASELVNKFGNLPDSLISEERILLTILKHKSYPDIEYIFEFQKELSRMNQFCPLVVDFLKSYALGGTIKGVPTSAYEQGIQIENYLEYNETLSEFLTNKIYEYYSWREHNIEKINEIYSKLLHLNNQELINIFTTNYDGTIESYCKESERQYNLVDGFEYDPFSRLKKWNCSTFDQVRETNNLHLFKLHGSLNWKRHRKHGIVKLEDIEKVMKNTGQYLDDILIKPSRSPKEEEGDEPYRTLISKFKERIGKSKICVVIGYSFRDEGINEIFDMFMKQGGRLIIISPDATKEFEENFIKKYHPAQAGYTLLDVKVTVDGIDGLINKINSHLP